VWDRWGTRLHNQAVSKKTMKQLIQLSIVILALFSFNIAFSSNDDSLTNGEKLMLEDPFLNITEKVFLFLKQNPSKGNLTLEELLKENVISADDYEFLIKNQIKYNPPSSAGPHDNYLSIFDRNNENGTSSHILYDLVDKSDPSITKTGTLSDLNHFISEWYGCNSTKKSLNLFKDENLYYFSLCYWDNEHWDKQHILLIDFPEDSIDDIKRFKKLINDNVLRYRENNYQESLSFSVQLPSNLSVIKKLSNEILVNIYLLSQKDVINYTPDGFRFKMTKNDD
jgi:hypothetical protein